MNISVVLVDDNPINRGLASYLIGLGRSIEVIGEFDNGLEAIDEINELDPQVVVMGISMSKYDGIEATRRFVAANPRRKVLMLSSHAEAGYAFQAFQAGATGYLLKSSMADELVEAIQKTYFGERYVSPGLGMTASNTSSRAEPGTGASIWRRVVSGNRS